jgi:hypothetical protein
MEDPKMKPFAAAVAAVAAALVPLAAQAKPAPKDRACFHASNVSGFRAPDDKTVYVRVGVRDIYQLEMLGACPQIDWAEKIGIQTRGSEFICSGMDADLISPSSIGPHRCAVRALRKLTPEEAKALPPKSRP